MKTPQSVAILGLGAMGSRIAANLLAAGFPLTVWNRSPNPTKPLAAKGATVATTPKQAAAQADIVISLVTDNTASKAVWLTPNTGALHGLSATSIAIESSTLTIDWVQSLSQAIESQNASFLAAPIVGSRPQAEAQKLICLAGGSAEILSRANATLSASASTIHHFGNAAQATAMKLAVNTLFGIQVAALAEILPMLTRQGIAVTDSISCLNEIPVTSPAMKGAGTLIAANKHHPMFPIHLVEKDFRYALTAAPNSKTQMNLVSAAHHHYQQAINNGYGDRNITAIARLYT
ncbi:MAG: NAD(P)-dependent oxidoreductase [Cyanobacteria bacterium J06623_4]